MKSFFLCLTVLIAVQSAWSSSSEELMRSIKAKMLESYLQKQELLRKTEVICPGYRDEFDAAITQSEQCWLTADEESETVCSIVRSHTAKCFRPINKVLEVCLPEKSRDIPQYVIDVMVEVANHICKSDGEHFFELFNQCARSPNYRTQMCLRRITAKLQQSRIKAKSKSDVCEALNSLKGCLESHLNTACGNKITREAFMDIYKIALDHCDTEANELEIVEWDSRRDDKVKNEYETVAIH